MREIEDKQPIWPFLLLSLLLHAVLLVLVIRAMPAPLMAEKPIEIIPIEEVPDERNFRIADIEKPAQEHKPSQAKFLGMYDSSVSQESVSVTKRPSKRQGEAEAKKPAGGRRKPARKSVSKDRLFAFDQSLFDSKQQSPKEQLAEPGGALDDFYPDFKRGARTYLNVLRHPDVEYFVRLKRAFKIAFNPVPALKSHFANNLITRGSIDVVLGVSVNRSGNLSELFVFRSSGIPTYDQEALRTVRSSSPFSTPPDKFVDDDGLLRMSWTFTVYL
jgi:TonB family protein